MRLGYTLEPLSLQKDGPMQLMPTPAHTQVHTTTIET